MHFHFLLSDPHGDIELSAEDLNQPFLISPAEPHPFLTLADYFGALQSFVLQADGDVLRTALKKQGLQAEISLSDISGVIIRSEKHGAFYHIASVEIVGLGENVKFALTTALSESARTSLGEEYVILQQLSEIAPDFIPKIYCKESVKCKTDSGSEEFLIVLGEWLDGYHEWHASDDPESGDRIIHLWDYANGYRFLSDEESYEMLSQVAYILTYYYDQISFCQIYPWHHGAGDFVVKAEPEALSVKLITARQYEPLVQFDLAEEADRLVAAIHFLLNLGLRIRLDRLDGVGGPAWFGAFAVHAAVAGFFTGLAATQKNDRLTIGPVAEFLEIMQSFDTREIYDMYESLLEIYAEEDQDDFRLIQEKLTDHAAELHETLQGFSLKKS
ncbi:MAG: hypothetical protein IME97_07455 [Proteobacteria bacterium]|nr:hypothetical protein [Pseudomonadota bacterium]